MRPSINLARYDLVSVRLAVFCAESGTLSSAAKRANMSLSRASYRLTSLEDCVGHRLFHRRCNGLEVTQAGAILVGRGKELLRTIEEMGGLLAQVAEIDAPQT